jgi:hypothetical protein
MKYPFEVEFSEIVATPEPFVSAIVSSLVSDFLRFRKAKVLSITPCLKRDTRPSRKRPAAFLF